MHKHEEQIRADNAQFGFWIYLMTDLLMFAGLFACFAVLRGNTFGGPSGADITRPGFVLVETLVLLVSSFTCGLATIALHKNNLKQTFLWFGTTFALGVTFLAMELSEFSHLIHAGNGPSRSAFLSSYFTLVGTHGLHITVGLLWMLVSLLVVWKRGLTFEFKSKLTRLAIFWHFLDLVWIFIFTFVYLMGVAK